MNTHADTHSLAFQPGLAARTGALAALAFLGASGGTALGQIVTTPTSNVATLKAALPVRGLTVDQIIIRSGSPGQIGTYVGFKNPPITIDDGLVLSSGNVAQMGPLPEMLLPDYEPSSPPAAVNSAMDPGGLGGTFEFDDYGHRSNNIENFNASYDVAAIEVHFSLDDDSQVKFDFIFGSVEYPYWTSQFTDAFLVFLDGVQHTDMVTFDANGNAVQVGSSFAGLTRIEDTNTAFANPHGLIHHLTTTTPLLESGEHVLIFEVGDVNDQVLDSAVFITNLRAEAGTPGTEPSDDPCNPADIASIGDTTADSIEPDHQLTVDDVIVFVNLFSDGTGCPGAPGAACSASDVTDIGDTGAGPDGQLTVDDIIAFVNAFSNGCA